MSICHSWKCKRPGHLPEDCVTNMGIPAPSPADPTHYHVRMILLLCFLNSVFEPNSCGWFWILCTSCKVPLIFQTILTSCCADACKSVLALLTKVCEKGYVLIIRPKEEISICTHNFVLVFTCAYVINSICLKDPFGILTIYSLQVPAKQTVGLALQALYQRCVSPKVWCSHMALLCHVVLIVSYLCREFLTYS